MIIRPLDIPPETWEAIPVELQIWLSREASRGFASLEINELYDEIEKGRALCKKINSSANLMREHIKVGLALDRLPLTPREVLVETAELQEQARLLREQLSTLLESANAFYQEILGRIAYLEGRDAGDV